MASNIASTSAPTKEFERLVLARKIRHSGHPILRWSMRCTAVKSDPAGNIKPAKPDRLKSSKRIDPIVTAIIAIGGIIRHQQTPTVDADQSMFA